MSQSVRKNILLVEDEALLAMNEKMQLEKYGYAVKTVTTGEKAVEAVQTSSDIDLILMDINLGSGIDGTQAAEMILQDHDVPIVFLSSHTDPEVVEKTEKITSYGYVVKSSSITVLDASIKMAFKLFDTKQVLSAKEEALLYKHEFMSYVIEHNRSAIAVHDRDLKYLYVSQQYLDSYRVNERDVIGKHHYEVFPDIPQKWREVHQKALRGEVLRAENDLFERDDGTIDVTRWECRPWYEQDGTIGGIIVYTEVITEQKKTERELAENVKLLSQAQEIAHIGNWRLDVTANVLWWSDEIYRMFGCEPQEFAATYEAFLDFVHPDDRAAVDRAYTGSVQDGSDGYEIEHRIVRRDSGEARYIHERCNHERDDEGTIIRSIGMAQDITERKQAEESLQAAVYELQKSQEVAKVGNWVWHIPQNRVEWSEEMYRIFGIDKELFTGDLSQLINDCIHPDDRAEVNRSNTSVMEKNAPIPVEYRIVRPDGSIRFCWAEAGELELDEEGKPIRLRGIVHDITERKEAENRIKEYLNRLELVVDAANMAWWEMSVDSGNVVFNSKKTEMLGYSSDQFHHYQDFTSLVHPDDYEPMMTSMRALLDGTNDRYDIEYRIKAQSGDYRWFHDLGTITQRARGGTPLKVSGIVIDTTERKRSDEELEASQKRYQTLVENSPDIIYLFGTKSGGIFWSEATRRILGLNPSDIVGDPFLWNHSIHPDDKPLVEMAITEAIHGQPFDIEYRIKAKNGDWIWLRDKLINRTERDGEVIIQGHAEDITEQKYQRKNLEKERHRLSAIIEGTNVGTWEWNVQTGEIRFNEKWAAMIGYTLDEIAPVSIETWRRFAHSDDLQRSEQLLRSYFNGDIERYEIEARMRHKDGHWLWVLNRGKVATWTKDGKPEWIFGTHQDITDVKLREQKLADTNRKLEHSEMRYRSLFEKSSSVMLVIDPTDGRILRANPSAERFYGWTVEDLTSMRIQELNQDLDADVQKNMTVARTQERNVFYFQHRTASGTIRDVEVYSSPIQWDGKDVLHSIIHDITDRVALEAERTKLSTAVEHSANAVVVTDVNGIIEYANPRFTELTGYSIAELAGKKTSIMDSLVHTKDDYAELWQTILSGNTYRTTFHNQKKSGERYWESASIAPIHTRSGEITNFVKIAEDVTERMEREQLLQETAEKLQKAVVRQETLMAELNHRVKNNLAMVTSLLRLENDRLGDSADLTDILTRVATITAIHQQLQESNTYDTVDLRSYITQVVTNAISSYPSVELVIELEQVQVATKTATTLGLIMNEIATNAVKYGFNEEEPARFSVTSECKGSFREISVTNSGNQFPVDVSLEDTPSLGLRLVSMLTSQLGGEVALRRTPQPLYTFRLPLESNQSIRHINRPGVG